MANRMRSTTHLHMFLILLVSQWAALQGRQVPWEFDSATEVNPENSGNSFSTTLDNQSEQPSFAAQADAYNYAGDAAFSTQSTETTQSGTDQYNTFSSTDNVRTYDTFIDSPETVQGTPTSLADQAVYQSNDQFSTIDPHDNDEAFYDTTNADIIYKGKDEETSLSAYAANATSADDTLLSLAKAMGGCGTGNPIDDCWRCDPNWRSHRQALANCAIGFGRNAIGGKNGPIYVVTNNGDDLTNPRPGTLRYGVTRTGPLWIIFAKSMTFQLKGELWVSPYKTIDGRGADIHIVGGSQVTIQTSHNVILHGLHIHDIKPSGPSTIRVTPSKLISRSRSDGDAIHIWGSHDVWVDHCYLARATDGLLDATRGSNMLTVSNCYFEEHNKVMLFGSHPTDYIDRNMRATVAYNKFGPGLIQRMPRCRFGTFHVHNNDYSSGWGIYAIGGSEDPTILSEGNYFDPAGGSKEVTKHINDNGPTFGGWQKWNWASSGDVFLTGAYFTGSGASASSASVYAAAYSSSARPGNLVPAMTKSAGPLPA